MLNECGQFPTAAEKQYAFSICAVSLGFFHGNECFAGSRPADNPRLTVIIESVEESVLNKVDFGKFLFFYANQGARRGGERNPLIDGVDKPRLLVGGEGDINVSSAAPIMENLVDSPPNVLHVLNVDC